MYLSALLPTDSKKQKQPHKYLAGTFLSWFNIPVYWLECIYVSQDINPVVCYLRSKWSLWCRWLMLSFPLGAATKSSFNESVQNFLVGDLLLSLGGHTQRIVFWSKYSNPVPTDNWNVHGICCGLTAFVAQWSVFAIDEPVVFTNSSVLCICSSVFLFLLFLCLRDSEYSESLFLWQYFWSSWATRWMDIKQ